MVSVVSVKKETQVEILKKKTKLTGASHNRITEAEEWISDLEDKRVEITTSAQNKEKRMKRIEDSLRDLWENIKCANI